jgi:hypothetical protein
MSAIPRTIPEYLQALRDALRGADPALVQDALHDAEEYLRGELAERPDLDEASMLAEVASSYGAPEEVAAIYTEREHQVQLALQPTPAAPRPAPVPPPSSTAATAAAAAPIAATASPAARFFGVVLDPYTYGSLFYLLLALPLGVFYFIWVATGIALSLGLAILIIGVPFTLLFIATVYALSLVEGRLVEGLLGVRMPRRPTPQPAQAPLVERIKSVLGDPRTWSTLFYMLLKLPLGIVYFTASTVLLSASIGLAFGGVAGIASLVVDDVHYTAPVWTAPFVSLAGVLLFFVTLHLARVLGRMHGGIAKAMLVRRQPD